MRPAGWHLWLWWALAGTAAWAVGGPAGVTLGRSWDIIVGGYAGVTLGGILAGVLQWLLLRRQIAQAGRWVLASIMAAAAVGALVFGVGVVSPDVGWVVGAGLFGAVVGMLQWLLVLRRQVAQAGWWVLASTIGWVLGGPAASITSAMVDVSWAVLGVVYGAITGAVLVRLLRQPVPAASQG